MIAHGTIDHHEYYIRITSRFCRNSKMGLAIHLRQSGSVHKKDTVVIRPFHFISLCGGSSPQIRPKGIAAGEQIEQSALAA